MATRGNVGKTASNALRSYNRIINNITEQCDKYRELCKYMYFYLFAKAIQFIAFFVQKL